MFPPWCPEDLRVSLRLCRAAVLVSVVLVVEDEEAEAVAAFEEEEEQDSTLGVNSVAALRKGNVSARF
jgi:hypothetical protein